MKAIAADPIDPAMFKKSVKLGIKRDIPVMIMTMTDLTSTLFVFLFMGDPSLKKL